MISISVCEIILLVLAYICLLENDNKKYSFIYNFCLSYCLLTHTQNYTLVSLDNHKNSILYTYFCHKVNFLILHGSSLKIDWVWIMFLHVDHLVQQNKTFLINFCNQLPLFLGLVIYIHLNKLNLKRKLNIAFIKPNLDWFSFPFWHKCFIDDSNLSSLHPFSSFTNKSDIYWQLVGFICR